MQCHGLKMEAYMMCLKISKESSVAGAEWMTGKRVQKEARDEKVPDQAGHCRLQ